MTLNMLQELAQMTGHSVEEYVVVSEKYPFALTPFIMQRVRDGTYSTSALHQFLPDSRELENTASLSTDSMNESYNHPEKALIHLYDNRVVFLMTYQCLVYCRFCFRKASVGLPENQISTGQIAQALSYIRAHPEIEDVILSGGDPLALSNRRLLPFLRELTSIPHIKVIRIDSRAISTNPQRIDDELIDFLKSDHRFWYHAHMNHPDDINHPEVVAAIHRLLAACVPVLNQSVILKGVNDDRQTLCELMKRCYYHKVIPYNLYIFEKVRGAAHFEVSVDCISDICEALSHLPGPAQPVIVYVDINGRKHRIVYDKATDIRAFFASCSQIVQSPEK